MDPENQEKSPDIHTNLIDSKNLIGFKGEVICGDINVQNDLKILNSYKFNYIFNTYVRIIIQP